MRYNSTALNFRTTSLRLFAIFLVATSSAETLTPLAPRPDWKQLEKFQQSITREEFLYLLNNVYAPGAWKAFIKVGADSAAIDTRRGQKPFVLQFARSPEAIRPAPRYWRQKAQMPARPSSKPLSGVRIAIDPGHIGGSWAKMEERWFRIGNSKPVTEGDMTLLVAKLLVPRLEALGATVYLTRSKTAPVTSARPSQLRDEAVDSLRDKGLSPTSARIKSESELLFYRVSEIRRRAELINKKIKPDIVLCLHFNAEAWGNPARPTLTSKNHMHFLITGAFGAGELEKEDQRFDMLDKLLSRAFREELALTESVAASMAAATGLPPYTYSSSNAVKVGRSPYVWGRNLLANRLFECPVVYVEPYVMNSKPVFDRVQLGDYKGRKAVGGRMRQSIFREYADGIVNGLVKYYSSPSR